MLKMFFVPSTSLNRRLFLTFLTFSVKSLTLDSWMMDISTHSMPDTEIIH